MRVLFLSPYVPHPVRHGGHNRTLGLIRVLSRLGSVHVMAIGDPADPGFPAARAVLASHGASLEVYPAMGPGREEADALDTRRPPDAAAHFRSPGLAAALAAFLRDRRPDIVHLEELVMAQYASAIDCPIVIDRQKVECAYHEAMASLGGAQSEFHGREAARFRGWEASLAGRFAKVLVVGPRERDRLTPLHGAKRIEIVPIAVDDSLSRPEGRTAEVRHVLLYGSLDYPPNVLANEAYFSEVWPRLKAKASDLTTLVVGSGAPPPSLPADDPRLEVRGYVPEVGDLLRGPGALVVPLRVGGGARTKVLEALAAGMPVVSTAVGVENLGLVPGEHYLRAETAEEMVEAVLRLHREPPLVERLGRWGAALVEERHRWGSLARALEPIYRGLVGSPARSSSASRRVLLVGVHPWPRQEQARALSFPGHRTEQFASALERAGCEVEAVLLDEEGSGTLEWGGGRVHLLAPEEFRAGVALQGLHDYARPEVVVSAGGFHAARVTAGLATGAPRFIDLPGDLPAEGQLRAARGQAQALLDHLAVLARALAAGDAFSVVGTSQRLALLGQLGLSGRLTGETLGREPVAIVPVASDGPASPPPLPPEGFRVLWAGGYNTWMDEETLFRGLEEAMSRRGDLVFVSSGGPVPSHVEASHRAFWSRARASRFASRFEDLGRLPRRESLRVLASSHVVLSVARSCLETELGSRLRLVEAMANGRAVVSTEQGDLARGIGESRAGLLVPQGDPFALASALLRLAGDREQLASCARAGRALWEERFTYEATTGPLRAFAGLPSRWPASALGPEAASAHAERVRLQAELDAIRASRTFRALRLLDRVLGRAGGRG